MLINLPILPFSWSRDTCTLRAGDSWGNKTPVYYFSVSYNVGKIYSSCTKSPCGSSTSSMEAHCSI